MKLLKILSWITLVIYILFMIKLLFRDSRGFDYAFSYNLIPFATIQNYIVNFSSFNFTTWFLNLFGNVIAFMPLGFLVPVLFKKVNGYKRVLVLSFLCTVLVEVMQLLLRRGSFDVDDIILNTLGGLAGYCVLRQCVAFLKKSGYIKSKQVPSGNEKRKTESR